MATATRQKKTKTAKEMLDQAIDSFHDETEWTNEKVDMALRLLCCPTPQDGIRWREVKAATDAAIWERLAELWETPVSRGGCHASSRLGGVPLVWVGQEHSKGTPALSGYDLACRVRALFGIREIPEEPDVTVSSVTVADAKEPSDLEILRLTIMSREVAISQLLHSGATDPEIFDEILAAWKQFSKSAKGAPRPVRVEVGDETWHAAIWIGGNLTGAPRWWYDGEPHGQEPRGGHNGLIQAVRSIYVAPAAAPVETPKRAKGSKAKATEPAVSAAELLAGVEVVDERDVPWAEIQRSPHNPRVAFDPQLLKDMEPTIESICRLNPLTLREGTMELIDGETRHRAAEARKPALRAKIIRCTDAQAAAIRLLTSLQRRDLNPIERAAALKALQEQHGLSQRQLQDLVKLKQGSISNLTRLLDLPPEWQKRVISGEITATQGRELAPWRDEPTVLAKMAELLAEVKDEDDRRYFDFGYALDDIIYDASKPVHDLKLTDEQRKQARIRTVKIWNRQPEERAFNVALIEEIQAVAEKAKRDRELKRLEKSGKMTPAKAAAASEKNVSAAELKRRAETQEKIVAKRLFRFRVTWHQAMLVDRIQSASVKQLQAILLLLSTGEGTSDRHGWLNQAMSTRHSRSNYGHTTDRSGLIRALFALDGDVAESTLRALVAEQVAQNFEGYRPIVHPEEIETLAELLGVDLTCDWSSSFELNGPCEHLWDDYVDVWSKDQLLEVLGETQARGPGLAKLKRSELQGLLSKADPCPKALIKAKAVRLV